LSECQKRFGDWGLFNSFRDGVCTVLGVPTVVPPPAAPPEVAPPPPTPTPPTPPHEITSEQRQEFRRFGDVNMDGIISDADYEGIKECYGKKAGDPEWERCRACDLNDDGAVDLKDLTMCARNQGLTIEEWKKRDKLSFGASVMWSFDVLSANWREAVSSFAIPVAFVAASVAPIVAKEGVEALKRLGVIK